MLATLGVVHWWGGGGKEKVTEIAELQPRAESPGSVGKERQGKNEWWTLGWGQPVCNNSLNRCDLPPGRVMLKHPGLFCAEKKMLKRRCARLECMTWGARTQHTTH